MRLLVSLIGLGIRLGGFPIRLARGTARMIRRRLGWLRPIPRVGLYFLAVVRGNGIASTAIILAAINFGLLMWQIWPDDKGQMISSLSQPTRNSEAFEFDKTPGRLTELENHIRDLSIEQRLQFDRLIDCINYPSPFGCQRHIP